MWKRFARRNIAKSVGKRNDFPYCKEKIRATNNPRFVTGSVSLPEFVTVQWLRFYFRPELFYPCLDRARSRKLPYSFAKKPLRVLREIRTEKPSFRNLVFDKLRPFTVSKSFPVLMTKRNTNAKRLFYSRKVSHRTAEPRESLACYIIINPVAFNAIAREIARRFFATRVLYVVL